jgi:hypothetical protein
MAQARLLLAQQRPQEARSRLAALARWAEEHGCTGYLIAIRILQAWAEHECGAQARALGVLAEALLASR